MAINADGQGFRLSEYILNLPAYEPGIPAIGIPAETYLIGDIIYENNSVYVATTTTSVNPVGDQSGDWLQLDVNATQWFDGSGSPLTGLPNGNDDGDPGDFYINNDNGDVFRKLVDNTWPIRKVLQFETATDVGFATTTKFSPAAVPVDSGNQASTITVTIADNFAAASMGVVSITNHFGDITGAFAMTPVLDSIQGQDMSSNDVYKQFTYDGVIVTDGNTVSTWTMRPTNVIYVPTRNTVATPGLIVATINILDITTNSRNVFYRGWVPNVWDITLTSTVANNLITLDAQLDNDEQAITLGTNFQTDADEFDEASDNSYCIALPMSIGAQAVNAIINLNGEQRIPLSGIIKRIPLTIPASGGYSRTPYTFFLIDTRTSVYASLDHIESQQLEVV